MKIGTEDRTKVIVAVVLLLIGVFVVIRQFSSSSSESATTGPSTLQPLVGGKTPAQLLPENSLDPRLRLDLLKNAEDIEYKGNGRNIFRAGAEPVITPPIVPPMPKPGAGSGPGVASTPTPTINLKFFGFATRQGVERKVFLSSGDDVFVASQGDIVNRRYKILRVTPTSVEVEDVLNNVRQTINLSQG